MSQNMNRRLFFMFLTTLAKTPKWELRQVLPQINVVNAFKSSVKKKNAAKSTPVPTWKLSVAKKPEPETPSAPPIEIKIEGSDCFKKKQEESQKEECQRRKRYDEDSEDSDHDSEDRKDVKVRIRDKKRGNSREQMYDSCRNWTTARGKLGNQHKWK